MNNKNVVELEYQLTESPHKLLLSTLGDFLDQYELDLLMKHSQIASFESGEILLHQGEIINNVYVILKGTILVSAQIMGRGVTNLETLHGGQLLTTIGLNEPCPCPTSFIATSPGLYLIISKRYVELLSLDYPETKYKLLLVIAQQTCNRLKIIHDVVTSFISNSDMTSLSFFERVIYSLNQPKKIIFGEKGIDQALIQNISSLKSLTKEETHLLCTHFIILDAPKNSTLISEGEKSACCYLVLYGAIQSCIIKNNKLAKLSVIGPGTFLASIGCIENITSFNFTYITCEHTILCKLPETALQLIKNNHPQLWYKLFYLICTSFTSLKKSIDKLDIRLHIENYNR
ncbi:cyclic nucleotide-binding domain-containing protein [Legionella sp. PC997]|uniref:cyclic nucleotide-binding domain-containing protein n=1 Tax=Legionella sp. PC997 TaxID=2755562 RepID=UPI0015FDA140|nr:cyclic nucleotide-binding domain-containing protein [Legionella sp. PC997]QMT59777.1 cyclic nucleotide-binding domain-containing protein [Legionella sp. PC997]